MQINGFCLFLYAISLIFVIFYQIISVSILSRIKILNNRFTLLSVFMIIFSGKKTMAVKIYADAGSNLFPYLIKKKNVDITLVNMKLFVEDKVYDCYKDDIDINSFSRSFYEDLEEGKEVRTSLINPNDFLEAFKKDIKDGHQIVCFTMAKGISGTYQSACLAASEINEECKEERIYVVDSATAGFGEGIQAIRAAKLAKKGRSFKEIINDAEEFKFKVRSEFTVDNIKYLAKTGRVSKIVAKIANVLRIKVLLKGSDESTIVSTGKVAGRTLSIKKLARQCVENIVDPKDQVIYISHCNCYEDAFALRSLLEKEGVTNIEIYNYDLITGSHLGPRALAIFYVGNNRD